MIDFWVNMAYLKCLLTRVDVELRNCWMFFLNKYNFIIYHGLYGRPTRALNLQIFIFSPMQNSLVRAIVWVTNLLYVSYQQTLLKQQILYRKTAHSLSKVV